MSYYDGACRLPWCSVVGMLCVLWLQWTSITGEKSLAPWNKWSSHSRSRRPAVLNLGDHENKVEYCFQQIRWRQVCSDTTATTEGRGWIYPPHLWKWGRKRLSWAFSAWQSSAIEFRHIMWTPVLTKLELSNSLMWLVSLAEWLHFVCVVCTLMQYIWFHGWQESHTHWSTALYAAKLCSSQNWFHHSHNTG